MMRSTNVDVELTLSLSPLTPEIEKFRLGVEISNFRKKGWEKRIALAIKVVHLAEIYKKAHGLLPRISNRFAGKLRKPVGNDSPRKNLESSRSFTFFGVSRKRVKIR